MNSDMGISIGWIHSRDKEGSGFFGIEGLCDGTEYIHLSNWVIVAEDAVEVSIFNAIYKIKEEW